VLGAVTLAVVGVLGLWLTTFGNPEALWWVVKMCRAQATPAGPCLYRSPTHEFLVIKDLTPWKPDGYLLTPTDRVYGIESPLIFSDPVAEFWQFGWEQALHFVDVPPERIGLAINSVNGRSQNQLHIHLSCVHAFVAEALANAHVTNAWAPQPFLTVAHQTYNVRRVDSLSGDDSPFRLAAQLPGSNADMGAQTIAVVGMKGGRSFYVLEDYYHDDDPGSAEDLLDERCSTR
jgi:CDP-diacylglycerol pyrophosphatase